jgi:hypothetical protein
MRIGTRVWLLLVVVVAVVLGASTLLRTADQREILGEALVRDRQFLGDALRASVARSTRGELLQAVSAVLESPGVRAAHISARLVDMTHGSAASRFSAQLSAEQDSAFA